VRGSPANIRFAWLNARETRDRRLEEAKAAKQTDGQTEDNTSERPRWLATQVSAVRDEPSSSPHHSRPQSPDKDEKEDQRSKDRLEISKALFDAMLLQSDTPPPPPVVKDKKHEAGEKERDSDPGIRTSALVKMGVLPVDVAMWGVFETMKSEREEGGMEDSGADEFRLDLQGL